MTKQIWKFPLTTLGNHHLPQGAKLLHINVQRGEAFVWALCDSNAPIVVRYLNIYGTGHVIHGDPGEYVGTFHLLGEGLVFHVFDGGE